MKAEVIILALVAGAANANHDGDQTDTSNWPPCVQDCVADDYNNPCTIKDLSCSSDCDADFLENEISPLCYLCDQRGFGQWRDVCMDSGYCFYSMSTVSVLDAESGSPKTKEIKELKVGDKILSKTAAGKTKFAEVRGLPKSEAKEDYIELNMGKKGDELIRATIHHTFKTCTGKTKKAHNIKGGDCLFTAEGGKGYVHKAVRGAHKKKDETYTLVMEKGVNQVAVGGVFTDAMRSVDEVPEWVKPKAHAK